MKKLSFNQDWLFAEGTITMMDLFNTDGPRMEAIDLPHDAMIHRQRTPDTLNAHQTGFYPGGTYTYLKRWAVPADWEGKTVELEFEGIADHSRIYLNGALVSQHVNPYTDQWIDAAPFLRYGEENDLRVEVLSIEQSSRWYTGAGIYRSVNVWVGEPVHIPSRGNRIQTEAADTESAELSVMVPVKNRGLHRVDATLTFALKDRESGVCFSTETQRLTVFPERVLEVSQRLSVVQPKLWSDAHPHLYDLEVVLSCGDVELDRVSLPVGIRTIRLSAARGLMINGQVTKLRGTCIHHDNGLLGAATFRDAEFRRCRILKEAGFNAIRSAHHPMSKYMLEACDELGMLVMDELSDMWTRTKNPHDYANYFPSMWQADVQSMVEKDFNHPSVILYSTGNEIPEAGTPAGAEWNRKINGYIKALDATRFTTNAINGLMAGMERITEMAGEAAEMLGINMEDTGAAQESDSGSQAGADAVNSMAQIMVGPFADALSRSKILESMIGECASVTDIAGYNYLTGLHGEDHLRHPNRLVLGTETFPADIVNLWSIVRKYPHVLGDFTWTGYDYLGEAGCGIFNYDGVENFSAHWPDRLAGIGDIDILGERKPISHLREAVFGLDQKPGIGVLRMDKAGLSASMTPWMFKDNIASWTWPGFEGKTAQVDVYSSAEEVELFLNGESLGRKAPGETFTASYEVPYQAGLLEAVAYQKGQEAGRSSLRTAGKASALHVQADRTLLHAGTEELAFVKVFAVDDQGVWNRSVQEQIKVCAEGNLMLLGYGSANPSSEEAYDGCEAAAYDGCVMAVVKAGKASGHGQLMFRCGEMEQVIRLEIL